MWKPSILLVFLPIFDDFPILVDSVFFGGFDGCGCFAVGLFVEVGEKEVEENGVREDDDDRPFGVVAVLGEEDLHVVDERQAELTLQENTQIY